MQIPPHAPVPVASSYASLEWPRKILMILAVFVVFYYLGWRAGTLNPNYPIFSMVLYGAEIFGMLTLMLHLFMMWRLSVRTPPEVREGATVDVFIPTINEPVSVVRRTALTAHNMKYPHQTWILDDGDRPEIRALATELGCGYITRDNNRHAKAGNLNNALAQTSGEFIAIFDADHAPRNDFLLRTLGYFNDARVGFVQTPQDFYNLDSFQHRAKLRKGKVWTEQSLFFRVIQRGKDVWNAAFFCGSCAVIRRSALEEIGGFATGTVTEDLHTSIRIHKAGYKSVYHSESLAFGIAAANIEPFLRQRIRWGQGAMQVWKKERILFSRHLTWPQKLCYLTSILTYFEGWQKAIYYFTPALVLCTGIVPIQTTTSEFLLHFVPYLAMSMLAFHELGRGYSRICIIEQYNMIRFAAFCWATFGLLCSNLKFRVTNKNMTGMSLQDYFLIPQYAVLAFNMLSLAVGAIFFARFQYMGTFPFTANIVWAVINMSIAGAVVIFTVSRLGYRRQEYRFNLPLAIELSFGQRLTCEATISDISPAGCRLVLPSDVAIIRNEDVSGRLFLPDGAASFHGLIRSLHYDREANRLELGLEFQWENPEDCKRLELFLFGSDREWVVNNILERKPTMLEKSGQRIAHWHDVEPILIPAEHFRSRFPMLYRQGQDAEEKEFSGILLPNGQERGGYSLMTFTPMLSNSPLIIRYFNGVSWNRLAAEVVNENKENAIDFTPKSVYVYRVKSGKAHVS